MENGAKTVPLGSKELKLKASFKRAAHSLLTAFPFEEFSCAFPKFTRDQLERLYKLYVLMIASLHHNMQVEIDSLCHQAQVGTIMDTVGDFVEQQSLDPLFSQKTNLEQVKHDLLTTKKNEIHFLQDLLDKVEDEKHRIKARIKLLRKTQEETSGNTVAVIKLKSMIANHASYDVREQDAEKVCDLYTAY